MKHVNHLQFYFYHDFLSTKLQYYLVDIILHNKTPRVLQDLFSFGDIHPKGSPLEPFIRYPDICEGFPLGGTRETVKTYTECVVELYPDILRFSLAGILTTVTLNLGDYPDNCEEGFPCWDSQPLH